MVDVAIRKASAEDDRALAGLNYRAWSPLTEITPRPVESAPFFGDGNQPEHYLVPVPNGQPVGYLRLVQPIPIPSAAHVRQIQGLVVDESVRHQGIGSALLRAAGTEARRQGATRLTLRVLSTNTDARRLYESLGFTVEGTLRGEFIIEGRAVDDILMARTV
ncbi:GNAT family N-acetyltransferase [Nocardia uniformis]|uniref:GNAT family N-acetyltransferase n=1 Tax=Nocardia uniformis TaxID=53432 RepID=A0A849CBB6_9NOCA|nr:GNAT family N-acetyltransferase [Nocardia uniformis]NNH72209.1 GNAT family N-acetyltransferase [Nocardia uniformis]